MSPFRLPVLLPLVPSEPCQALTTATPTDTTDKEHHVTDSAAQAFVERLSTDEGFRDQLAAAPTPEERLRIANDAGFAVGPDDVGAIRSAVGIEELSDEDLEKVAGGMSDTEMYVTISLNVALPAAGAAAAAI